MNFWMLKPPILDEVSTVTYYKMLQAINTIIILSSVAYLV